MSNMRPIQSTRPVAVRTALGDDVLLFRRMHGSEALGRLFELRLELASVREDIGIGDVLGKELTVSLALEEGGVRHFHGIVTRFASVGRRDGLAAWEAVVRPALWLLTQSSNCRIFQERSALDIVKAVCADSAYGGLVKIDAGKLSTMPVKREYCVQYRESDFDFVSRLLEEEGIYYAFRHEAGAHTVVLADGFGAHAGAAPVTLPFWEEREGRRAPVKSVTRLNAAGMIQPAEYVLNDFDFEQPAATASGGMLAKAAIAAPFIGQRYRQYDYPGRYRAAAAGEGAARVRMEALHGQGERVDGVTNARAIGVGTVFSLDGHPRAQLNREFLVTAAEFDVSGPAYRSGASAGGAFEFSCTFQAVGKQYSYRPPRIARKPVVQGPQTALVVGKAGEEIWTDKYGRIKVQFHWERERSDDETSSCWVRVQQGWAGKGWGTMFIPRIGMEVVVAFLEGDPDQPLVTGCVYNAESMPPYPLPGDQTRSTIKTRSSKAGAGFNELRFEDRKDAEEIFIHAERDCNRVVENNDSLKVGFGKQEKGDQAIAICHDQGIDVGNDRTLHVGHDQVVTIDNDLSGTVKGNETHAVNKNQAVTIDGDQELKVGKDRRLHVEHDQVVTINNDLASTVKGNETRAVSKDQSVDIDGDQKVKVGKTVVIEAATSIELKVGGSSIKLEPGKITMKSPQVAIEADGMLGVKAGGVLTVEGALVKIN